MKYESPVTYHSKDMANVKIFADRQTGQKLYAPNLSIRGHKNISYQVKLLPPNFRHWLFVTFIECGSYMI
jgi:hypothetical protein